MENSLPQAPVTPNPLSNPVNPKKYLLPLLIVLVVLLAVGGYILYSQKSITSQTTPVQQQKKPTTTPTNQTDTTADLENCQVSKPGNPLVDNLTKLSDGTVVGTFRGNINNVSIASKSAKIELVSPKADQIHTFTVKQERGLVFDAVNLKELALTDLKRGQTLVISFNCFPKNSPDKQFKITRIAITSKR